MFKTKQDCRRGLSKHALEQKFSYRVPISCPHKMVYRCVRHSCPWRVYAKKRKNSDAFEVRKINPLHTCNVEDRVSFQRQATYSVIGELLRPRYQGTNPGPRPNEIRQLIREAHQVPISYWKAWRSRKLAMEMTHGSYVGSFASLPGYIESLAKANPNSVIAMETTFEEGIGNRFKYLFFSFAASIAGFGSMRKVLVIDGTHLKGTYGGCLITASAQDGNFQIFPLAFGVVCGCQNPQSRICRVS